MRGDDYVGSFIAKRIIEATDSSFPDHVFIFDAEDSPESLISTLSKIGVRHVVFIDACEMRVRPGQIALLSVAETSYPFFTTHGIPLKVLAENLLAGCEVWVLSIQPKQTDLEEELSPELREAAEHAADFIIVSLSEGGDEIA
jgi:hydrogenase maturation protease